MDVNDKEELILQVAEFCKKIMKIFSEVTKRGEKGKRNLVSEGAGSISEINWLKVQIYEELKDPLDWQMMI